MQQLQPGKKYIGRIVDILAQTSFYKDYKWFVRSYKIIVESVSKEEMQIQFVGKIHEPDYVLNSQIEFIPKKLSYGCWTCDFVSITSYGGPLVDTSFDTSQWDEEEPSYPGLQPASIDKVEHFRIEALNAAVLLYQFRKTPDNKNGDEEIERTTNKFFNYITTGKF